MSRISQEATFAPPEGLEHLSQTSLREKLFKVEAKIVRYGRCIDSHWGSRDISGSVRRQFVSD